jgi:hypothetical protein
MHDNWVVLAKSTGDAGPNWIKVIFDPGGDNLVVWNGWVWDQEPEILRFLDRIVFLIFAWVHATKCLSWRVHVIICWWHAGQ